MKKKPYLGSPAFTAAVLRSHHISARKKYGQNFLVDPGVLEDTVEAAGITEGDCVLEVGPGIGTLTQYLAYAAGCVVAVEIDRDLEPVLSDTLDGWDNVKVIYGDIMKTDIGSLLAGESGGRPVKAVANLPYYITTPVLLKLLEDGRPLLESITVMVQKEVAERMQAAPGTKAYGALTLAVRYYAETEIVRTVPPSSFMPRPGVDSAVIHLRMRKTPAVEVRDEALLFNLVRASFNQRRKKLVNGIGNFAGTAYTKEDAVRALASCGLDEGVRGETLTLDQFADIANALANNRQF